MTTDFKVVNMVAGTRLTDSIDLYSVSATLDVPYEAEQFPGMVYRVSPDTHGPTAPTLCLLLFSSGKCVATGAKAYEDVETAMSMIHADLSELNAELLGIEMCHACEHTFPRDLRKCPNCGESSPLYG